MAHSVVSDGRYGLRQLCRTPSFTAAAVATLALGIGANTAIFSVVRGVLLAPRPYKEPDWLALVWLYNRTLQRTTKLSYSDFLDWQRGARSFQQMAAFTEQIAGGRHQPSLVERSFRKSPQALGKSVTLDGVAYTVAGVLPPEFRFLDRR